MNDKTTETTLDIAKVLEGNEDEVKLQLAKATAADLTALYDAETVDGAKNRKGVKAAIEAEQADRAELAKDSIAAAVEAADHAGTPLFVFTDRDQFEEPGEAAQLKLRIKEMTQAAEARELEFTNAMAERDEADKNAAPKPKKAKKPRALKVDAKALPVIAALAFADAEGQTLKNLPDMDTHPRFLKKERGGMAYVGEVVFPEGNGRAQDMSRVFALDANGKAIAECRLVSPLPVGGASESRLPPGSLYFGDWPKPEADTAAG